MMYPKIVFCGERESLMQIYLQHRTTSLLELRLAGRGIDATWGDHLSATIEEAVRGGSHHVALDCNGVDYISSLGIGVIVTQYKLLQSVKGSLIVTNPSKFVREILTTVGLAGFSSRRCIERSTYRPGAGIARDSRRGHL